MPPPTLAHRYVYIAVKCRKFLHCGFHFPRVSSSQPKLTITPMATSECLALTRDNVGDGCVELRTTSKIILDRRIPNIAKIIDWHRQPSEMSLGNQDLLLTNAQNLQPLSLFLLTSTFTISHWPQWSHDSQTKDHSNNFLSLHSTMGTYHKPIKFNSIYK